MSKKSKELIVSLLYITLGAALAFVILDWNFFGAYLPVLQTHHIKIQLNYGVKSTVSLPPNVIFIPSLDVQAPIGYPEEISARNFEQQLEHGVVHYPKTALPGEVGNVYIFGHSSDFLWAKGSYKNIFARLPQLAAGDTILVTDGKGNPHSYKVSEKKIVSPNDTHVLQQDLSKYLLTLQTSYPLGTALKRYIVTAELLQ